MNSPSPGSSVPGTRLAGSSGSPAVLAWQATMARLDAEERLALLPLEDRRLSPSEIVAYLRSLPALWADSGPDGRQALVSSIFARTDVLGFQRLEYDLTPDAIDLGLDAALPRVLELEGQIGEFGRGERNSTFMSDAGAIVRFVRETVARERAHTA